MAEIISFNEKLLDARDRERDRIRKRKIQAVRKVYRGNRGALRCERCAQPLSPDGSGEENPEMNLRVPYNFCETCTEEYIDFVDRLKGGGDPDCYWRNDIWLEIWKRWIDFQGAVDRYIKTKEFVQLLEELKKSTSD